MSWPREGLCRRRRGSGGGLVGGAVGVVPGRGRSLPLGRCAEQRSAPFRTKDGAFSARRVLDSRSGGPGLTWLQRGFLGVTEVRRSIRGARCERFLEVGTDSGTGTLGNRA